MCRRWADSCRRAPMPTGSASVARSCRAVCPDCSPFSPRSSPGPPIPRGRWSASATGSCRSWPSTGPSRAWRPARRCCAGSTGSTPTAASCPAPTPSRTSARRTCARCTPRGSPRPGASWWWSATRRRPGCSSLVEAALAGWTATAAAVDTPPLPAAAAQRTLLVDRPGSVQTTLRLGRPAPRRTDPGYAAFSLANLVFGGYFSSPLGGQHPRGQGLHLQPALRRRAPAGGVARGGRRRRRHRGHRAVAARDAVRARAHRHRARCRRPSSTRRAATPSARWPCRRRARPAWRARCPCSPPPVSGSNTCATTPSRWPPSPSRTSWRPRARGSRPQRLTGVLVGDAEAVHASVGAVLDVERE